MICHRCNGTGKIGKYEFRCSQCYGTGSGVPLVRYAGIGARVTPADILLEMSNLGMRLAMKGCVLQSGGAGGADSAFEQGCDLVGGRKIIRQATLFDKALEHAARFHPNWEACDNNARGLHSRNSLVMLGDWLDTPVNFVVCWTEGGQPVGGTGQALRIANAPEYNIPVFNLAIAGHLQALDAWINGEPVNHGK